MSVAKIIYVFLISAVVLGGAYLLTIMQPGPQSSAATSSIETVEDTSAYLREAENIENQFAKRKEIGAVDEKDVADLRRAVALREKYISITGSTDRLQNNRLLKSQTLLQNIDAKSFYDTVTDFQKRAEAADEAGLIAQAADLYNKAYELQNKINSDFPLSEYKSISRTADFERRRRMMSAKPLYEESLALEREGDKANEEKRWADAQSAYQSAVEKIVKISIEHPNTPYVDFARKQRIEGALDSLRSAPLEGDLKKLLSDADEAEKKADYMQAAEYLSDAAQMQARINKLFPKSITASEERAKEILRRRDRVFSSRFGKEILDQKDAMDKLLFEGKYSDIAEISSNLIRKTEQFKKDFKEGSSIVPEDLALELRYINYMVRELPEISDIVKSRLKPVAGYDKIYMYSTEIPQSLYSKIMQDNPSRSKGDDLPVDSVTFEEAEKFCKRLSWLFGKKVSLPDIEMTKKALGSLKYVDINAISWNISNSSEKTQAVGTKKPNDGGFCDLLGNVSEIVVVRASDGVSYAAVGGNAQTATDSLLDFPETPIKEHSRSRMTGFRIIVEEKPAQ